MASKASPLPLVLVLVAAVGLGAWFLLGGDAAPDLGPELPPAAAEEVEPASAEAAGVEADPAKVAQANTTASRTELTTEQSGQEAGLAGSGPLTISGRLMLPNGNPAADMPLNWQQDRVLRLDEIENLDIGDITDLQEQGEDFRTDDQGRFRIAVEPNSEGRLALEREEGFLFEDKTNLQREIPGFSKDTDLGDMPLVLGGVIKGRVLDVSGAPVADADVRLGSMMGFRSRESVVTDATGEFELKGVVPGEILLSAVHPSFVPGEQTVGIELGQKKDDVLFRLERGASISGRIVDDLGKPIAGASVAVFRMRETAGMSMRSLDRSTAVETDANGDFVLAGLAENSVSLRAWADGFASRQRDGVEIGTSNLTVTLARAGAVSGVLVDNTGAPIGGSRVNVESRADEGMIRMIGGDSAETDAEGRFTIQGIEAGQYDIVARGKAHRPTEPVAIEVIPGETAADIRLVADLGAVVLAKVVDQDGLPVVGALVEAKPYEEPQMMQGGGTVTREIRARVGAGGNVILGDMGDSVNSAVTDEEGIARLQGLPVGSVQLNARHDEMAPVRSARVDTMPDREVEQVLTMKPGGFIDLRTVDSDGVVLADLAYTVTPQDGSEPIRGHSNGEGVARVGPLAEGSYTAAVSKEELGRSFGNGGMRFTIGGDQSNPTLAGSEKQVSVRAGQSVDLELIKPILTHVHGLLTDASGPVAGAEVTLGSEENAGPFDGGPTTRTDRDGRYQFEDVESGDYVLRFGREGALIKQEQAVAVMQGQRELLQDLELGGGNVSLKVLDHEGMPLAGARVEISDEVESGGAARPQAFMMISRSTSGGSGGGTESSISMGGPGSVETGTDGSALLRDIPAGRYVVKVTHPDYAAESIEGVEVRNGDTTDQGQVTMSTAGKVEGTVEGFAVDAQMRFALVFLQEVGSDAQPERTVAQGGEFRFDGVAPGFYELWARPIGRSAGQDSGPVETIEVKAFESSTVTLQLPQK